MSIVYAAIISNNELMADYPAVYSSVKTTVNSMIPHLSQISSRHSFTQDNLMYHTCRNGNYIYICVAETSYQLRICYGFLNDIISTHQTDSSGQLRSKLRDLMAFFNNPLNDRILGLQHQIDDVKNIMIDNIDKALLRQVKLEDLESQSELLSSSAKEFKRGAIDVKRSMFSQNIKLILLLVCILMSIVIALILFLAFIIYLAVPRKSSVSH